MLYLIEKKRMELKKSKKIQILGRGDNNKKSRFRAMLRELKIIRKLCSSKFPWVSLKIAGLRSAIFSKWWTFGCNFFSLRKIFFLRVKCHGKIFSSDLNRRLSFLLHKSLSGKGFGQFICPWTSPEQSGKRLEKKVR